MQTQTLERVNVAPSSDDGHFVEKAKNVVFLDDVTEAFKVEGSSELVTSKHTTLKLEEDCLINCQFVYDPFSKRMERSRD